MLCGAVKRQARQVVVSRYANAFNINESNAGWKDDLVREDSYVLVHCLRTSSTSHTRTHTHTHTHTRARAQP
jgi:meiotically up-regulated gene 157 (Mug157) protein